MGNHIVTSLIDSYVILLKRTFPDQKENWAGIIRSVFLTEDNCPRYTVQVIRMKTQPEPPEGAYIFTESFLATVGDSSVAFPTTDADRDFIRRAKKHLFVEM